MPIWRTIKHWQATWKAEKPNQLESLIRTNKTYRNVLTNNDIVSTSTQLPYMSCKVFLSLPLTAYSDQSPCFVTWVPTISMRWWCYCHVGLGITKVVSFTDFRFLHYFLRKCDKHQLNTFLKLQNGKTEDKEARQASSKANRIAEYFWSVERAVGYRSYWSHVASPGRSKSRATAKICSDDVTVLMFELFDYIFLVSCLVHQLTPENVLVPVWRTWYQTLERFLKC